MQNEQLAKKYNWKYIYESDIIDTNNIFLGSTDNINWKLIIRNFHNEDKIAFIMFETEINTKIVNNIILWP